MNRNLKFVLKEKVWEKEDYASSNKDQIVRTFLGNPAQMRLLAYSKKAKSILDLGCGDGRIIEVLWRKNATFTGLDISERAIKTGKKRFKNKRNVNLQVGNIESVNLPHASFDLVFSCYTLEHTDDPDKAVEAMIALVKKGGLIIIICPNFGSPFHPSPSSPPFGNTLTSRAIKIFIKSHIYTIFRPQNLEWSSVCPMALKEGKWRQDWDTTVEPYLQTLVYFLSKKKLLLLEYSSFLKTTDNYPKVALKNYLRSFFEFLGKMGVPPYKFYGPTCFVVALRK